MIVECYSADVYCDMPEHPYGEIGHSANPACFTGRTKRDTDQQRRKDGWVKIAGQDCCPACKARLKNLS